MTQENEVQSSAPMTLNEAAFHLCCYLTELEANHMPVLQLVLKEFAAGAFNKELLLFRRAVSTLHRFNNSGTAVLELDPSKGCDITFKAKLTAEDHRDD